MVEILERVFMGCFVGCLIIWVCVVAFAGLTVLWFGAKALVF